MKITEENQPVPAWNVSELLARVDNDQELLCELVCIFKEDFPGTLQSLQTAVSCEDLKSASSLSHALKGMLSNLAAARAAAAAAKLEKLANAGEKSSLKPALMELEVEAGRLLPEIDAYVAEVPR